MNNNKKVSCKINISIDTKSLHSVNNKQQQQQYK